MKNKFCILFIIISLFLLASCDILRFDQFEISSWSPGGGYHSEPDKIEVSLNFSREPDKASIERNFSLTGNGNRIKGNFIWNGNKVIYSPLTPFEINIDYILSLTAEAHDSTGLSMDDAFNCYFSTRPDNTRPMLISCFPSMNEEVKDPRAKVKLEFSIPVPIKTIQDNVTFIPSMSGLWVLHNEGRLAVFTPSEPWLLNSKYEIHISTSLSDNNGMNIGNDFLSVFSAKIDHEIPYLLYANRITKKGEEIQLVQNKEFFENQDWEKEDLFSLVFSEPVDSVTVKYFLNTEDGPNPVMLTDPGFSQKFIFNFENIPAYESRFTLRIKPGIKDSAGNESKEEYVYKILANGKYSKPPLLMGIRIPLVPFAKTEDELVCYGNDSLFDIIPILDINYPSGKSVSTWIELYFSCAENASIDLFSLMELFRIETSNNVLVFSPCQIKTSNFSIINPSSGWENYQRIEITGNLTNTTDFGLVYFHIAAGLKDSFGNKNDKTQKISLIK